MKGHDQGASRWELSERVSFGSELPATPWRLLQQQSERRSQAHSSLRRELPDGNKCCVGTLGMNEGSAYLKRGWWLQVDYTEQRDLLEDTELAYLPPPSGRWGASLEISLETLLTSVKPAKDEVFKQECLYSDRHKVHYSLFSLGPFSYSTQDLLGKKIEYLRWSGKLIHLGCKLQKPPAWGSFWTFF